MKTGASDQVNRKKEMAESGKDIIAATTNLARRMNMYTIWRMVSVSMLWGICITIALVSVSKFVTIPIPLVLAIPGISLLIGVIRGLLARVSDLEAAIIADARLGFKERLSSAVEILGKAGRSEKAGRMPALPEMAELQLEDAANYARSLDPKTICPRVFPMSAKILPLAGLVFVILMYVPPRYDQAAEVSAEVRQAIKQTGVEIEATAEEIDKSPLSDEVAKLASKMAITGRELQDKSLTKKDALKDLSNLSREIEALKMMGKIAEKLAGDMTLEKKRILNELLEKLADNLKDLQGMEELSQKIMKVQQDDFSMEALKELSAALERMKIEASDIKALQQMSEQVAKGKQDIGQIAMAIAGGMDSEDAQGRMGGTAPGKAPAKDAGEAVSHDSRRLIPPGAGYEAELEGQLSEEGRSIPSEIHAEPEKGKSLVPYEEIYVKYRDAADDAITRTPIPWAYREHVKSYFDAIKPRE